MQKFTKTLNKKNETMNLFIGTPNFGFQVLKMGKAQTLYVLYKNNAVVNRFWAKNDLLLYFIKDATENTAFIQMELLHFVFNPKVSSVSKTKCLHEFIGCIHLMEDIDDNKIGFDLSDAQLYVSNAKMQEIKNETQKLISTLQKHTQSNE